MANRRIDFDAEQGVGGLMSLSQRTDYDPGAVPHIFFTSSDEDDDDFVDVQFFFDIPRGRNSDVASAQVQAFVIKYIEEWGETPNQSNLQLYMDTIYQMSRATPRGRVFTTMDLPIHSLDHERQTELLTMQTQYEAPSPKPLKVDAKRQFKRAVDIIYCPPRTAKKKNKDDEDICTICMESVESGKMKKVQIKNCKHKFHQACLQKWVSCNWCCPTCKQSF